MAYFSRHNGYETTSDLQFEQLIRFAMDKMSEKIFGITSFTAAALYAQGLSKHLHENHHLVSSTEEVLATLEKMGKITFLVTIRYEN